ncbi:hypothetical protein [Mycolicibacterium stellerae]|uniref:hypothetical protein n=1 Tax=Mycolicibacterium stellerae TaxID=2358193 RepID=UPI000F0AF778|nr:hypothetical protein [Mycolicibacterium stellerae]
MTAAASTARRAADDLRAAKAQLLNTVRAAEAAGFEVGQDFSLTIVERATVTELAAREAQMRSFGIVLRADILRLVKADEDAGAEIADAADRLRSLDFGDDDRRASDRAAIQTVDFHGVPLPEKPPNPPPLPPPEGWSQDPLMRAAQKIAYGHAWDQHRADFPGISNQAQFAEFIYQKMQRATNDPGEVTIGVSRSDGVPVIYDPKDNVLIVRDTRPNATDGGTAFKPDLVKDPNFVSKKFGSYQSAFSAEELADRNPPPTPSPSPPKPSLGSVGPPSDTIAAPRSEVGGDGGGGSWADEHTNSGASPNLDSRKDWGTYVPPGELAKQDGALGILGRILSEQQPPDPHNPNSWA